MKVELHFSTDGGILHFRMSFVCGVSVKDNAVNSLPGNHFNVFWRSNCPKLILSAGFHITDLPLNIFFKFGMAP